MRDVIAAMQRQLKEQDQRLRVQDQRLQEQDQMLTLQGQHLKIQGQRFSHRLAQQEEEIKYLNERLQSVQAAKSHPSQQGVR